MSPHTLFPTSPQILEVLYMVGKKDINNVYKYTKSNRIKSEVYSEPSKTPKIELFMEVNNGF